MTLHWVTHWAPTLHHSAQSRLRHTRDKGSTCYGCGSGLSSPFIYFMTTFNLFLPYPMAQMAFLPSTVLQLTLRIPVLHVSQSSEKIMCFSFNKWNSCWVSSVLQSLAPSPRSLFVLLFTPTHFFLHGSYGNCIPLHLLQIPVTMFSFLSSLPNNISRCIMITRLDWKPSQSTQ